MTMKMNFQLNKTDMDIDIDYEEMVIREDLIYTYIRILEAQGEDIKLIQKQFDDLKNSFRHLVKDSKININNFYDEMVKSFNNPSNWNKTMNGLKQLNHSCEILRNSVLSYSDVFRNKAAPLFKATVYSLILCNVVSKSLIIQYS